MDRLKLDGIIGGSIEEQGTPNATLQTIGLVVMKGGQRTVVTNQNLTITANSSGDPRVDMIEWDGNALSVQAGTPGASPVCPSPTAGSIPIAVVWVPDSFTTALDFATATDVNAVVIALYRAVGGIMAVKWSTMNQTITGSDEDLTQSQLPLYFPNAGFGYKFEATLLLKNDSTTAKAGLNHHFRYDAANLGQINGVLLAKRDTAATEQVTLTHVQLGGLESVSVGAHRILSRVSRELNDITIGSQALLITQIR